MRTTFAYDGLNRVETVTYTGETGYQTPQVTYTYSEAESGFFNVGRLTKVKTAANATYGTPETIQNYDYDSVGQVKKHIQTIGNQSYNLEYGYNLAGQLISEKYPSGKIVNMTVDNFGVTQTIADAQRTYLNGVTFDNRGVLSQINFGNGTNESFSHNDRFQMESQSLNKGAEVLQKYDYGYGQTDLATGNIDATKNNGQLGKVESFIGANKQASQRFAYDSIGRLSESREHRGDNDSLTYKQKFDFDRFGNLYRKAASNPTAGQANPLPYTPIEETDISKSTNRFTTGTTYDEAGQVITDNKFRSGMSFLYDANGRNVKASITGVPDAWTVYDALGNRVATKVNNVWQYIVYDAFGKLVAEYGIQSESLGGVKYIQQDWQGSVRAVTSNTGFIVSRNDHQAFGDDVGAGTGLRSQAQGYSTNSPTRQGYGLTENDAGSGQQHTWFRKLETSAGRWSSPDPYKGSMSLGNPQSFNRYSYVGNEPTNYVDPSGLLMQTCELRGGEIVCGGGGYYGADRGYGASTITIREYRQYLDRDRYNYNSRFFISFTYDSFFGGYRGEPKWSLRELLVAAQVIIQGADKECAELLGGNALNKFIYAIKDIKFDASRFGSSLTNGERVGNNIYLNPNGFAFNDVRFSGVPGGPGAKAAEKINNAIGKQLSLASSHFHYAVATIIHEFLHLTGEFGPDGNAFDTSKSEENQKKVLKACFPKSKK